MKQIHSTPQSSLRQLRACALHEKLARIAYNSRNGVLAVEAPAESLKVPLGMIGFAVACAGAAKLVNAIAKLR